MKTYTTPLTILKISSKGALLVTDGSTCAWIMPSQHRADGTFTPGAYKALETGKPFLSKEEYAKERQAQDEAKKWVKRPFSMFQPSKSGKAYGTKVAVYECISEQTIGRWLWFPASQCRIEGATLIIPRWLADAKIAELKADLERPGFSARSMDVEF